MYLVIADYNSQWEPAEEGLDLASLSIGSIEITQSDEQLSATKYIEGNYNVDISGLVRLVLHV